LQDVGYAYIKPDKEVVAGEKGTWTLIYIVGTLTIKPGGRLLVVWRHPTDWMRPQTVQPEGLGYLRIYTEPTRKIRYGYEEWGWHHPWEECVWIEAEEELVEGDSVYIIYGDKSAGGKGIRAQSFAEDTFEFRVIVIPEEDSKPHILQPSPTLRIIGGEAKRLKVIASSNPHDGVIRKVVVKAEDKFGNRSDLFEGYVEGSLGDKVVLRENLNRENRSCQKFENIPIEGGDEPLRIEVVDKKSGMTALSNPIVAIDDRWRIFWGDLHTKTELSDGTGSLDYMFQYARDVAGLDFVGTADHDNILSDNDWERLKEGVEKYNRDGEFVTFLGYEWSQEHERGGDRNVYFLNIEDAPIFRCNTNWIENGKVKDPLAPTAPELHKLLLESGLECMVIPHVGGRLANMEYYNPQLEFLLEIYSIHGFFEWFAQHAMTVHRFAKFGFIAGSDDHMGKPGDCDPGRSYWAMVHSGLMAVLAPKLTRGALWDAMRARRVYATTGERIILDFRINGHIMGSVFKAPDDMRRHIKIRVWGTDKIDRVDLIRNGMEYKSFKGESDIFQLDLTEDALRRGWNTKSCMD